MRCLFICFLIALVSIGCAERTAPIRIAPIGDSITQGRGDAPPTQSYRYPLWKKLVDTGVSFDMVGSITAGFKSDPDWPDYRGKSFDRDHEGHWGWRADGIRDKLPGWLADYTPDIALVQLGGNDLGAGQGVASTTDEIAQIIDILRLKNPNVITFVGLPAEEWKESPALGVALMKMALEKNTRKSPVIAVNHAAGWISDPNQPGTHTVDWVHPNRTGDLKMAQAWFEAMAPYLGVEIKNKPPTAGIKVSQESGPAPLAVVFDGSASRDVDGVILSYGWQFGDGSNRAGGAVVTHVYKNPGKYPVLLGVMDNEGSVGTAAIIITVNDPNAL